jgi:hypothetical protein
MTNDCKKRNTYTLGMCVINQKEDSHKNRMPTATTKIKGSNNYFSLISLNINGLNSPILPVLCVGRRASSWGIQEFVRTCSFL